MVNNYCAGCPFKRVYYVDDADYTYFSERCYLTLNTTIEVQPEDCYVFKVAMKVINRLWEEKDG